MVIPNTVQATIKTSGGFLLAALCVHMVCLLLAPAAPAAMPQAPSPDSADSRYYAIAAGPLRQRLAQFAAKSKVSIFYEPALVQNKDSAGLEGSFPLTDAFVRILDGSGLESVAQADHAYVLRAQRRD